MKLNTTPIRMPKPHENSSTRLFTLIVALGLVGACNRDADVEEDVNVPPATEVTPAQAVRVTDVELPPSNEPGSFGIPLLRRAHYRHSTHHEEQCCCLLYRVSGKASVGTPRRAQVYVENREFIIMHECNRPR